MPTQDKSDLFEFMLERIAEVQKLHLEAEPQAFGRWFAGLFYMNAQDIFVSDGSKDGQIDAFFTTHDGKSVTHHAMNTKFTREYNKIAPPAFYQEIKYFWQAFENKEARQPYLERAVKAELRPRYKQLFERYDNGAVELLFVTNHRINEAHYESLSGAPVKVFHLDDLIQFLVDDIDGAMPRTPSIQLHDVHGVLSPDKADTEVATSIVFARLVDFIRYMEKDPFDLLFNRNVRVAISTKRSEVNRNIRLTFKDSPKEFAFSNNGITLLCERQHHDPADKVLTLENPRVVNGSQTLHSIRDVPNPSANARVMVRIIQIEPPKGENIDEKVKRRKEVINKIAVRSNQQNPIKSWDLVSNDDFQMDLFRFFRRKDFFYERKNGEWGQRSRELRSVGFGLALNLRWMAQLIASFYSNKAKLGPAEAKQNLGDLFVGEAYEAIRQTPPEVAFQLFLVDHSLWQSQAEWARKKAYIRNLKSYAYFAVFAVATRAFTNVGADWGHASLTALLEGQWPDFYSGHHKSWMMFTRACIDYVVDEYKREAKRYARDGGEELTYANYFKNRGYVSKLVKADLPANLRKLAKRTLVA